MSEKIERHLLERKAILYVRQSSVHQVLHNAGGIRGRESSALQYAMRDRLDQLGWSQIEIIDEEAPNLDTAHTASSRKHLPAHS